ncbi:glycosyltransferase family 2 protein [Klebsiella variicola]|uniref:glycosyltransferase family 2 protein n=1 Tax=Enterobacteriaceae TaxID=543 RepID=UPI0014329BA8|nr:MULTISPECIES: glycosyltransferase family 2 protein [Enterobacteriaceae]MBJ8969167.1 glycosyltransferase family 2 protein [Citrobacter freundii]MCM7573710.1 glycosyltransferase family 2 protein [Enterobacter roggenkampii]MCV5451336.1 glycosyltransferase family 2 protein [Escherichia coli]NKC10496.1 glycosyltransferase family 2 protein [Klebsiella variicola]
MKKIVGYFFHSLQLFKYLIQSVVYGKQLKIVKNNLSKIKKNDILLFCTLRNEAVRIPFFIDYYQKLGVSHFIIVDNDSTDDFYKIIEHYDNVTVYYTKGNYKKSNFGMHWINFLLRKHGSNHWCMTCDPDEFLVISSNRGSSLKELTAYLDSTTRRYFFTVMVDMYSDKKLNETYYKLGENPLDVCSYFDKVGYFFSPNEQMNSLWVQGGVRLRTLFTKEPFKAPAINKTPLVKWKWYYSYISSMHTLLPRRLNAGYKYSLTGALLHYKYLSLFVEKVEEEKVRKQHYGNSEEYSKYQELLNQSLFDERFSTKLTTIQDLADCGLITNWEWL